VSVAGIFALVVHSIVAVTLAYADETELIEPIIGNINEERARAGLAPLDRDRDLDAIATERSADMAQRQYFSHVTPEGLDVSANLNNGGVNYLLAAENLAWTTHVESEASAAVMQGFLDSPPHRANLLNPRLSRIGVGVAQGGARTYFTVLMIG
jgi:uncharacterized protein YkwD